MFKPRMCVSLLPVITIMLIETNTIYLCARLSGNSIQQSWDPTSLSCWCISMKHPGKSKIRIFYNHFGESIPRAELNVCQCPPEAHLWIDLREPDKSLDFQHNTASYGMRRFQNNLRLLSGLKVAYNFHYNLVGKPIPRGRGWNKVG